MDKLKHHVLTAKLPILVVSFASADTDSVTTGVIHNAALEPNRPSFGLPEHVL